MIINALTHHEYAQHFELFTEMVDDFIVQSDSPLSASEILSRIFHAIGNITAFKVCTDDESLVGFVLCETEVFDGSRTLAVVAAYNSIGGNAWKDGWKVLNQAAVAHQCTLISCETHFSSHGRVYYAKFLKPLGFVPAYVTYKKEVDDGSVEEYK